MDAPVVSATALAAGGLPDVDDERPPWRRGRAGTSIGRAVHAVLQSVDLATGDGLDAAVSLQCDAERISHLTEEVRTLVSQVLAAPVVAEAAASAHWREVFVAAPVVDVLAEGFIDLLFARSDGSLVIVDYKTDGARSADDIDAAVARYRRQGAAYALMVETVLQRPVSDVVFVFARASAAARQRSLVDLRAAVAEVRAAVVSSALSGDRALA
jgi:ATP-dependent helicase/nuclease subunit A